MTSRSIRVDARRNRAALLTAADAAFAEHGAGASLSAVATAAGVAVGTLYKHFPTRRELVAVLLAQRHDELLADDTVRVLASWVHRVAAHVATYGGLADLLAPDLRAEPRNEVGDRLAADCARMSAATREVVDDAHASGDLRPEVGVADVVTLINAAAWVREAHGAEASERLIATTLRGMAP